MIMLIMILIITNNDNDNNVDAGDIDKILYSDIENKVNYHQSHYPNTQYH